MREVGPVRPLGTVAIVDHASAGGVSRFVLALLAHLATGYPQTSFVYYVSSLNVERDDLETKLAGLPNVRIRPIEPLQVPTSGPQPQPERGGLWRAGVRVLRAVPGLHRFVRDAYLSLRRRLGRAPQAWWEYRLADDVVTELHRFDVVYLAWPFLVQPIDIDVPIVATFHDFHFTRFPESYDPEQLRLMQRETRAWLRRCAVAVTSTRFIRDELLRFCGEAAPRIEIVYLAPYGFERPSQQVIDETVARLGIRRPYALFSGGHSAHKNLARVVEAIGLLKAAGTPVHLVITGAGSDRIGSGALAAQGDPMHAIDAAVEAHGLERGVDYSALGYVSNAQVDALTAGADVVVSASLYEAGSGPAMDAWQAGVPVAFSSIPPFLEQLQRFGVRAWVFDPLDPADIAEKIKGATSDTARSAEMVTASLSAFQQYNWEDVAREYYRVFAEAGGNGLVGDLRQSARPAHPGR